MALLWQFTIIVNNIFEAKTNEQVKTYILLAPFTPTLQGENRTKIQNATRKCVTIEPTFCKGIRVSYAYCVMRISMKIRKLITSKRETTPVIVLNMCKYQSKSVMQLHLQI